MTDDQLDTDLDNRFIFEGCPHFGPQNDQTPPSGSSVQVQSLPPSRDGGLKHIASGSLQSVDLRNATPDPEELTNWYHWGMD